MRRIRTMPPKKSFTLMAQSRDLKESLAGYETRAEALSQQIEEEQARTQEIEDLKQYMLTDEYAEQAAREKLGLVKENKVLGKTKFGSF